jgi:hypothetical protein
LLRVGDKARSQIPSDWYGLVAGGQSNALIFFCWRNGRQIVTAISFQWSANINKKNQSFRFGFFSTTI